MKAKFCLILFVVLLISGCTHRHYTQLHRHHTWHLNKSSNTKSTEHHAASDLVTALKSVPNSDTVQARNLGEYLKIPVPFFRKSKMFGTTENSKIVTKLLPYLPEVQLVQKVTDKTAVQIKINKLKAKPSFDGEAAGAIVFSIIMGFVLLWMAFYLGKSCGFAMLIFLALFILALIVLN